MSRVSRKKRHKIYSSMHSKTTSALPRPKLPIQNEARNTAGARLHRTLTSSAVHARVYRT